MQTCSNLSRGYMVDSRYNRATRAHSGTVREFGLAWSQLENTVHELK